jgi:ferredoxin
LYFWLRLKRLFPRLASVLLGIAVLLPVLALLGFYQQGRAVALLARRPEWRAQIILAPGRIGTEVERANLVQLRNDFLLAYASAFGLVLAARGVRFINERRGGMIRLTYPDRTIRVPKGLTVLEASYRHHVPHANVCGGKGRCSTCRIRIISTPAKNAMLLACSWTCALGTAAGSRSRRHAKLLSSSEWAPAQIRLCVSPVSCDHRDFCRARMTYPLAEAPTG